MEFMSIRKQKTTSRRTIKRKTTTKTKPKWTKFSLVRLSSNICTGYLDSQILGHFATICQMSGLCLGSETGQQKWLNDLITYAPGCGPERPAPLHAAGAAGFTGAVDTGQAWDSSHAEPGKEAGSPTWGDETSFCDSTLARLFGEIRPCQLLVHCLVQALWSSFSVCCEAYVRAHAQLHISVVPLAERLGHSSGHCVCGSPLSMCWAKNTAPCGLNCSERLPQEGTCARMGGIKWIFGFGLAFALLQAYV